MKIDKDSECIYRVIMNHWSTEAKKENKAYFYNNNEIDTILNGNKSFVIGRKGSGKTAIAQHLCSLKRYDMFSKNMSFKNFPFNILYTLQNNKEYTEPNQYISIWKYLIYTCICKMMMTNENIDLELRNKLTKLYGDSSIKRLDNLIKKWTSTGFGAQILGSGINIERKEINTTIDWINAIDILQQVIIEYADSSKYFIIFDELDEDYRDFKHKNEEINYFSMITSLFKVSLSRFFGAV